MKQKQIEPTILVIAGVSGDLSKKKLLPAIRQIHRAGILPNQFRIIGLSRRKLKKQDVLPRGDKSFLRKVLTLRQMNLADSAEYEKLSTEFQKIEQEFGVATQRLFYLSVPPQASQSVIKLLGEAGFGKNPRTKLLLEKPFGSDLESAKDLVEHIKQHFTESQVYRIDHFLAKEVAQNVVYFRAGNSLIKRTWSNEFIESIEITASEKISIEGRLGFYEQTGALRDLIQSHLLQLAAITLMPFPAWDEPETIPELRLQALKALQPPQDVEAQVVRGQYDGYRTEVNNPGSMVETFASVTLYSTELYWKGVPITLTTGKSLSEKFTHIRIKYRQEDAIEANELVLRIQPNEGAEILLWSKAPGYERELKKVPLDFSYSHHFSGLPDAYERVFVDAMRSNRTLFATSEEVLASWRLLKPIQDHWNMSDSGLITYEPGSTVDSVMKNKIAD